MNESIYIPSVDKLAETRRRKLCHSFSENTNILRQLQNTRCISTVETRKISGNKSWVSPIFSRTIFAANFPLRCRSLYFNSDCNLSVEFRHYYVSVLCFGKSNENCVRLLGLGFQGKLSRLLLWFSCAGKLVYDIFKFPATDWNLGNEEFARSNI